MRPYHKSEWYWFYWLALAIRIENLDPWYAWREGYQPVLRVRG